MNQPIPPPLVDGVLYIDNSSMELFTTCPRQAYYYIIRRLELNRDKIALDFGSAFHTVLEKLYKTYGTAYRSAADNNEILQFVMQTIDAPLSPEDKEARELKLKTGALLPPVLITPQDDYRTRGYLVEAVSHYLTTYPAESFEILRAPNGDPAVELPFAFPLCTIDTAAFGPVKVVWTGKMDMLYRSRERNGVMDHKTTSRMGAQYFSEFEFAHQMYGYVAAGEFISGEQIGEITINGLGCRKPSRTGEKFTFERHIIPVNRDLLAEWHDDCTEIVADFLAHCERGSFPKHTKWCVGKYGACQYRGVCSLAPHNRELALSTSEFKQVTWNPLTAKT